MKRVVAMMMAFFLTVTSWGCGRQETTDTKSLTIGLCVYNQDDVFISQITSRLRADAASTGSGASKVRVNVILKDAGSDQRNQNKQVSELLEDGVDILAVNLADRMDPSEIINNARDKDVPVIFFNREPLAADLNRWDKLYYVGADARQSGEMQGEEAFEYIQAHPEVDRNHDGMIQYVVLKGEINHQDVIIRTDTAVDTLLSKGIRLDKIAYANADWNRAQAQTRMSQLIVDNVTNIELVLANNDEMAIGAAGAYDASNITTSSRPAIFGIDGTDAGLNAMSTGKIQGTVYNNAKAQADDIYQIAMHLFQGTSLKDMQLIDGKRCYTNYQKVTLENIDSFKEQD